MTVENNGVGTVLVGTGRSGDAVLTSQGTAAAQGFRNLSQYWYPQTQSFDETMDALQRHYDRRQDIKSPLRGMKPGISADGKFVLIAQGGPTDGAEYTLTDYAFAQYLTRLDIQTTFRFLLDNIYYPQTNPAKPARVKVKRDKGDVETFVKVVENGLRHFNSRPAHKDEFLFRTYQDTHEIQAVLTKAYSPVDNRWFLKIVNELIPGGRYSHMKRADDNTLYGNVIIPDSIRAEEDSDYGGMLSLSNCEIGKRRLAQYPSIFRAICMNGCIWDQSKGVALSKKHRGLTDLDDLKKKIVANLQTQIPLAHDGIDRLLNTRAEDFKAQDVKMVRIFVAVADTFKLGGKHLIQTVNQYQQHEKGNRNLFGVINSLTRAAQFFGNEDWSALDAAGGALTKWDAARWNRLVEKAKTYDEDEIQQALTADAKYLAKLGEMKPLAV